MSIIFSKSFMVNVESIIVNALFNIFLISVVLVYCIIKSVYVNNVELVC